MLQINENDRPDFETLHGIFKEDWIKLKNFISHVELEKNEKINLIGSESESSEKQNFFSLKSQSQISQKSSITEEKAAYKTVDTQNYIKIEQKEIYKLYREEVIPDLDLNYELLEILMKIQNFSIKTNQQKSKHWTQKISKFIKGQQYIGQVDYESGLPHGNGKLLAEDYYYQGNFVFGQIEDYGLMIDKAKNIYIGEFRLNQPNGEGEI